MESFGDDRWPLLSFFLIVTHKLHCGAVAQGSHTRF